MANRAIPEEPGGGRLQGWKEIAHYLGVTVRTAQAWGTEKGLPVRRLGGERGRVYALQQELQAWMDAGPAVTALEVAGEPPEPARMTRRWLVWGLGGLLLCAVAGMAWRGWRGADGGRRWWRPHRWKGGY